MEEETNREEQQKNHSKIYANIQLQHQQNTSSYGENNRIDAIIFGTVIVNAKQVSFINKQSRIASIFISSTIEEMSRQGEDDKDGSEIGIFSL